MDVNTTSISANNNGDTITVNSGNKWIRFASSNNTLSIAHSVETISSATATNDLNKSGTFTTVVLDYDTAGHVTGQTTTTHTLPYNWKTITTKNSDAVTALTMSNASINAEDQIDEVTFTAANKWIVLATGTSAINFGHILTGNGVITTKG